jgi:hypothetical protein
MYKSTKTLTKHTKQINQIELKKIMCVKEEKAKLMLCALVQEKK